MHILISPQSRRHLTDEMATAFVWAPPYTQGLECTRVCVATPGSCGDALLFYFYFDEDTSCVRDDKMRGSEDLLNTDERRSRAHLIDACVLEWNLGRGTVFSLGSLRASAMKVALKSSDLLFTMAVR